MDRRLDILIIGAGAAGLFCGAEAGRDGKSVLVIDHAAKPAEKIRISGGGRCNFTNLHTGPHAFLSANPHFAKSALASYTPWDFCDLLARHGVTWHEKTLGQLFCDGRSQAVIDVLRAELEQSGGQLALNTTVSTVKRGDDGFRFMTSAGPIHARALVVATGGKSIPKMGATGFAYDIARQFGHDVITPRPALVPFTFSGAEKDAFASLSGVSTQVRAEAGGAGLDEAMLFTHRGLSGPAILQVSSYWEPGATVGVDLCPGTNLAEALRAEKARYPKRKLGAYLTEVWPKRLVDYLATAFNWPMEMRLAALSHARLDAVAASAQAWQLKPTGTEGWRTAEVTAGGVDTAGLSSKTMESRHVPGLYFIGECVDVTGWLGGYNFQWAWASAAAAGRALR